MVYGRIFTKSLLHISLLLAGSSSIAISLPPPPWTLKTIVMVWAALGHTVESLWAGVYQLCGENDWAIYVLGSTLATFTTFSLSNIMLGCLDLWGLPSVLRRYKIQKDKNVPMNCRKYTQALALATFNMSVMVFSNLALIWYVARRSMTFGYDLPTLATVLKELICCILIHEIGFYSLHRYMHCNPFLFKHVHKIHHEWSAPCSVAAFYCHPLEHFFVNTSPLTLAPALMGCHILTAWFFWASGIMSTTLAHSGYHFPFLPSSQSHEFHHRRGRDNYGAIGLLDWLLCSNLQFKSSPSFKKHFTLYGLTPVDQLVSN